MSQTYRSTEQNDSPEITPHVYGQVIYERNQECMMGKGQALQ